ncbi:MAG: hypothetical protein JNM72_28585 [Deltaproteobacteria bacterium]|nr:hypothetical protein [Deltaproteobacteria bacterium]
MGLALLPALARAGAPPPRVRLRGADGLPLTQTIAAEALLRPGAAWVSARPALTDPAALGRVAAGAQAWLTRHPDDPAATPALLAAAGVAPARLTETLAAVAALAAADAGLDRPRLRDPAFLAAHFEALQLCPGAAGAPPRAASDVQDGNLRITRYLVRQLDGRPQPEGAYRCALYADPGPAVRAGSTRAEVLAGAWDRAGAQPLVYLTEAGLYDALLQGTVEVRTPDGATALYNVDQNNGHAYDPRENDPARQRRYWSFRRVEAVLGYGPAGDKLPLEAGAVVAGDVMNLGLGALLAIEATDGPRLVVLADTGGAFVGNLHQLDYLGGAFPSHAALYAATAALPQRARVALLLWRGGPAG